MATPHPPTTMYGPSELGNTSSHLPISSYCWILLLRVGSPCCHQIVMDLAVRGLCQSKMDSLLDVKFTCEGFPTTHECNSSAPYILTVVTCNSKCYCIANVVQQLITTYMQTEYNNMVLEGYLCMPLHTEIISN